MCILTNSINLILQLHKAGWLEVHFWCLELHVKNPYSTRSLWHVDAVSSDNLLRRHLWVTNALCKVPCDNFLTLFFAIMPYWLVAWLNGCDVGLWSAHFPYTLRPIYGWQVPTLFVNFRPGSANSAFHPSRIGKWVVIHECIWITEIDTVKTSSTDYRTIYVLLYGYKSKSVAAGTGCGLVCTLALSVTTAPLRRHMRRLWCYISLALILTFK